MHLKPPTAGTSWRDLCATIIISPNYANEGVFPLTPEYNRNGRSYGNKYVERDCRFGGESIVAVRASE